MTSYDARANTLDPGTTAVVLRARARQRRLAEPGHYPFLQGTRPPWWLRLAWWARDRWSGRR